MRFRLYAIVARPISTFAPRNPRINRRGCPKIRYLIVAKGALRWIGATSSLPASLCPAYDSKPLHTGAGQATPRSLRAARLKGTGATVAAEALYMVVTIFVIGVLAQQSLVPVMRTVNNQGDGTLFGRADFRYEADTDSYVCPGNNTEPCPPLRSERPVLHWSNRRLLPP